MINTIIDKIKRIKESRISGIEKCFINDIDGMTSELKNDTLYWYSKRGNILFKQNFEINILWINYENWNFYSNVLDMGDFETRIFFKKMCIKYLDVKDNIIPRHEEPLNFNYKIIKY